MRELLEDPAEGESHQCVIVRHGVKIIKGKCRDRDSLVTSRGGRNFSSLGTYELTIMPDAVSSCTAGMRCIYYVSDAGPVRAYAIGDGCISAPAIAHLYARSTPTPAVRTSCVSLHCAES